MTDIAFSKVIPTETQINELYELLLSRKYTISHRTLPSIEEHTSFVSSHPYRVWYIVTMDNRSIGSFYLANDNTIGINLINCDNVDNVASVIRYVKEAYTPLPAIRSIRTQAFAVNVPPENTVLQNSLVALGAELLQVTYSV